MLAPKSASQWGWPNHPGLIGDLGDERHSRFDARRLDAQPNGVGRTKCPALCSSHVFCYPTVWSVVENRCVFWGEHFRQGRVLPRRPNALILMGDWCGWQHQADTAETKTRLRRYQAL